jgi:transposase-like protein
VYLFCCTDFQTHVGVQMVETMAATKRVQRSSARAKVRALVPKPENGGGRRARTQRSEDDKIRLVRQVMESGNQSAEIKKLGIYPNQFYDWKKKFEAKLGLPKGSSVSQKRGQAMFAARSVADEAKAFIEGKASLLERLRVQRAELDELITQLEG